MSWLQNLVGDQGEIARQTRQWEIRCNTCGNSKCLWEAGGIRYRARGKKSALGMCSKCGTRRWLKVQRKDADDH